MGDFDGFNDCRFRYWGHRQLYFLDSLGFLGFFQNVADKGASEENKPEGFFWLLRFSGLHHALLISLADFLLASPITSSRAANERCPINIVAWVPTLRKRNLQRQLAAFFRNAKLLAVTSLSLCVSTLIVLMFANYKSVKSGFFIRA